MTGAGHVTADAEEAPGCGVQTPVSELCGVPAGQDLRPGPT